MNEILKVTSKILNKYQIAEEKAAEAYRLAKKFGKKAEQLETKKAWNEALAAVIAVDEALDEMRQALEQRVGA
jgi:flagellar biosynthesis/type III secretory pathway protein FliH